MYRVVVVLLLLLSLSAPSWAQEAFPMQAVVEDSLTLLQTWMGNVWATLMPAMIRLMIPVIAIGLVFLIIRKVTKS